MVTDMEMNKDIEMLRLGLDEDEKATYKKRPAHYRRTIQDCLNESRKRAKLDSCYICKKKCTSFCNSHSVPQFCLKQVAKSGKVYFTGMQSEVPFFGEDSGVKSSGTFKLICRECDSLLFQDYENPAAYNDEPNGVMLAEIALKNYLQMISKRLQEKKLYELMEEKWPDRCDVSGQLNIIELDLLEYEKGFQRAKEAVLKKHKDWYHLCYYAKLDYVVPFAMQSAIDIICDFEGNIINDIFNTSPSYHTKEIHLAIFPLKSSSVVIMFHDSREKRYRKFYKQLNRLEYEDQLAAINYIAHSYCENIFLSKDIDENILNDKNFKDMCQQTVIAVSANPYGDALSAARQDYNLSKRKTVPNLLSRENALNV